MPTDLSAFAPDAANKAMENLGAIKSEAPTPESPMTFGQKLVGLTFNPSNDDKVAQAKKLFAAAADLLKEDFENTPKSGLAATLYEHTIGEILNAQMNVVKVLTLKY